MVFQLLLHTGYHNTFSNYFSWHNFEAGFTEKRGMDYKLTFFFFGEAMTIFLLVTIIFDFLLTYGKAVLASMHRRMLIHYKLILSGKEEVKEETR